MEDCARRLAWLPVIVLVAGALVPTGLARTLGCAPQQARYDAIHAQVKKAATKLDHDGSGGVSVPTFVKDLKRLQTLKARQRIAAQALQSCKR
jgi:hypothetical protein